MSCNTLLKTCFRYGTDYKDRKIDFVNSIDGLTNFKYRIKSFSGALTNLEVNTGLDIIGDSIIIKGDKLEELAKGRYTCTFFFDINGETTVLFDEEMKISESACDCATITDLSFAVVPVIINDEIVNIYLNFDDLTPEQKLQLKGEPFLYSDFTPEQLDGLTFHYSDFTPAQILGLQQPALDASIIANTATNNANIATQNANDSAQNANDKAGLANIATTNANSATDNAITATTNANASTAEANTAISNANIAITNAITATTNANDKALIAQSSATNAENKANLAVTATTNANNATTNANNKATLAQASSDNADTKAVLAVTATTNANIAAANANDKATLAQNKIDALTPFENRLSPIGGTVGKIIKKKADGSTEWANDTDLLVDYVHSGNRVISVSSIDYETNAFTSISHGLTSNSRISPSLVDKLNAPIFAITVPISTEIMNVMAGGFFAVPITNDTFRISKTQNGVPFVLTDLGQDKLSLWNFELLNNINVQFSNIPNFGKLKVVIEGSILGGIYYPLFRDSVVANDSWLSKIRVNNGNFSNLTPNRGSIDSLYSIYGILEIDFRVLNGRTHRRLLFNGTTYGSDLNNASYLVEQIVYRLGTDPISPMTNFFLYYCFIANGVNIKIYK